MPIQKPIERRNIIGSFQQISLRKIKVRDKCDEKIFKSQEDVMRKAFFCPIVTVIILVVIGL